MLRSLCSGNQLCQLPTESPGCAPPPSKGGAHRGGRRGLPIPADGGFRSARATSEGSPEDRVVGLKSFSVEPSAGARRDPDTFGDDPPHWHPCACPFLDRQLEVVRPQTSSTDHHTARGVFGDHLKGREYGRRLDTTGPGGDDDRIGAP